MEAKIVETNKNLEAKIEAKIEESNKLLEAKIVETNKKLEAKIDLSWTF